MRSLLSHLINPLPVFWILVILSLYFQYRKKSKSRNIFGAISIIFLLIVSTPFIPNWLVQNLENKYSTCNLNALQGKPDIHILVLGGGHTNDSRLPANNQLAKGALARLAEGIRILNEVEGSVLVTSGWSGKREAIPQAEVLAQTAVLLGVDSARIKKQILPKNTWMEASEYKRLFGDTATLVLVTSAIHMPRAMYLFQKAGLNPLPAPTDHLIKKGEKTNPLFWMPKAGTIAKTESAIHEYVGILWYKIGGK